MNRQDEEKKTLTLEMLSLGSGGLKLENISSLQLLLADGSWLGILPGHAAMIAATGDGVLKYRKDDQDQTVSVKAGILTLANNLVSILTTH